MEDKSLIYIQGFAIIFTISKGDLLFTQGDLLIVWGDLLIVWVIYCVFLAISAITLYGH